MKTTNGERTRPVLGSTCVHVCAWVCARVCACMCMQVQTFSLLMLDLEFYVGDRRGEQVPRLGLCLSLPLTSAPSC